MGLDGAVSFPYFLRGLPEYMTLNTDLRKPKWIVGLLLLVLGLLVRAGLAFYSPSIYWPDEIYQTLEPAHRLIFGAGHVMWEYREGLRSWTFPGFLAGVMWVGHFLGEGSTGYLALIALVLSAVSLIPPFVTYSWARRQWKSKWWPVVAMVFPLIWYEAIYFGPKALYEAFTIHLVVGAIFLVRFSDDRWIRPLIGGVIIGVCIITRPHLAPVPIVLGLLVPLYAERPHAMFSALVVGVVGGAGLAGIVDVIAYGVPFHSLVVNLHTNVIEGKASNWGTSPWWQYFAWAWELSRLGSLVMAAALILGTIRYPMLAWPPIVILAAHCAIPHKEIRFLYPVVVMATVIVGLDAAQLSRWLGEKLDLRRARLFVISLCLILWSAASLSGAANFNIGSTGDRLEGTAWTQNREKLFAYRHLSKMDICGLGRVDIWDMTTGGYSHFHHDVPIIPLSDDDEQIRRRRDEFDTLVVEGWERASFAGFKRVRCYQDTCIYARKGRCGDQQ
jgi:hypothetical protein